MQVLPRSALLLLLLIGSAAAQAPAPSPVRTNIAFSNARPIIASLRDDLLPDDLRGRSAGEIEAAWPAWVARHDAEVRARLERGDEDSIVNFLLFGVTYTKAPRITERDMAAGLEGRRDVLQRRIADLASAVASTRTDERLQLVRGVVQRKGIDPAIQAGQEQLRQYLASEVTRVLAERQELAERVDAVVSRAATDPQAGVKEASALFADRGLSSDTTLHINFGLEAALEAIAKERLLAPRAIRRVAIVGPGLDFTDKREGYDFYPQQTTQPFAIVDSLLRLGLADAATLRVTTFDLSPRINEHLAQARLRAEAGTPYVLQLPRDTTFEWNPLLVAYWLKLGGMIGTPTAAAVLPASSTGVEVRAISIRPAVVRSITPLDTNIVFERLDPLPAAEQFDLVIATNVLVYYGVFEQALALTNIAHMMRPGAFLLTNNPLFELPAVPIGSVGYTDVLYTRQASGRDRIFWYRKP